MYLGGKTGLAGLLAFILACCASAEPNNEVGGGMRCFQAYDEARPLFAEDFSLRLYRSGQDMSPDERKSVQIENDETRLSGTILSGGDKPVSTYTKELRDRVESCDAKFQIPAMSIAAEVDDLTCAGNYATMTVLALSGLQRANFRDRTKTSIEIALYIRGFVADYPIENESDVFEAAELRARELTDEAGKLSQGTLFDLIFEAQACDAKYGYSPMLIPGTVGQMFGLYKK